MTERLIGHSWRFSHPSDKSRDKCAAGKSSPKPGSSKSQSRLSPAKAILLCETGSELFLLPGNWKASQESELPRSVGDRANTLQGQHKWQLYVVLYELYVGQNCGINVFLITHFFGQFFYFGPILTKHTKCSSVNYLVNIILLLPIAMTGPLGLSKHWTSGDLELVCEILSSSHIAISAPRHRMAVE